ncbi:MAG: alpha-L-rhamnosidase N-terminal domain-containing protein [Clostridia bacterium]|nr:alpha-L-rhamnosidase N-terminal domain-containing protein [Clostridia bacterium]
MIKRKLKLVLFFISFILIVLSIFGIFLKFVKKSNMEEKIAAFDWNAKYIWVENIEKENGLNSDEWVCFRKSFSLKNTKRIKDATMRIAVDSKYWLYINGEIVVRDGQLKRGERINSIYYDELNISKYLHDGDNNISILVWYFGKSGFSHIDSGQGALLLQAQIGDMSLISDESWKALRNPAFLKSERHLLDRLSESDIKYNANLELGDWYNPNYDDSNWKNSIVYGEYNDTRWGDLIKREIPFFYFSNKIEEYENSKDYNGIEITKDTILEMKTKYNMQLVPYFKIDANENSEIMISNDKEFINTDYYGKINYITKNGVQEFESPSWINGDKIYYFIPAGTKIITIGYRATGYDAEMSGSFKCNDDILSKLWEMSNRTLYVNMRDSFMDCPDRERALWMGDASLEMEEAVYGMDTNAYGLYIKSIKEFIGWKKNGIFYTVPPSLSSGQYPVQNMLAINSMYNYYNYSGDLLFLEYVYPNVIDYMTNIWNIGEDGLVGHNGSYYSDINPWFDSSYGIDELPEENILYYYTIKNLNNMAIVLKKDNTEYEEILDKMYKSINDKFWDGTGYKSEEHEVYDSRVNSLAVISGIADESKYESISQVLVDNYDNSTFMEWFVLEALCKMGKIEQAQNRIKNRYKDMVTSQDYSTTLWEYWEKGYGSKNHAWSGSPLVIMSKYFAGIQPLSAGYENAYIKPDFGGLNQIDCTVNTLHGKINLSAKKNENELTIDVEIPVKTLVAVEKMTDNYNITINNKKIYVNGELKNNKIAEINDEDERYVYLFLERGKYEINSN